MLHYIWTRTPQGIRLIVREGDLRQESLFERQFLFVPGQKDYHDALRICMASEKMIKDR